MLDSSVEIHDYALSAVNVFAFALDSVFRNVVADPAHDSLVRVIGDKLRHVGLAAKHQVRVAGHLPHAREAVCPPSAASFPELSRGTYRLKMFE